MRKMNFLIIHIIAASYVQLATSQASLKWNKRLKDFEVISEVSRREREAKKINIERKEQLDKRNFNGQPLKIAFFEQRGNFEFFDNDTKARGIFGEIWTTLCTFLNFTMVLSKEKEPFIGGVDKNGTLIGILKKVWFNESDVVPRAEMYPRRMELIEFSTSFWMQSLNIYSRGHWKRNPTWVLNIFTQNVWITIFTFLVILSIASIVAQRIAIRYRGKNFETESILSHIFYNLGTLCNQPGSTPESARSGSNLLNVTIVLFAYLTLVAYNSHLIFSLAQESFAAPFTDIDSLMDKTKYKILLLNGSKAYGLVYHFRTEDTFKRLKNSPRLKLINHANNLYSYVCKYPDEYVFLDVDDDFAVRGKIECDVEPVGYSYFPSAIASGFRRDFEARKTINLWLVKFRECGLVDRIKKRYMSASRKTSAVRQATGLTIGMDHVVVMFGVLCSGIIGSIIICIAENIIFRINRSKVSNLVMKKMSNHRKPVVG